MTLDVKTVHVNQRDNPEYIFFEILSFIDHLSPNISNIQFIFTLPTGSGKNFEDKKNWNTLDLDP